MSKERFERLFDLKSFEGHLLKWECQYYEGKSWHTSHRFYVDEIELKLEEYYSQAYIPFDKRDDEIATCTINNNKKVSFTRKITERHKITFEELKPLLEEKMTICGYKIGDKIYDKRKDKIYKIIAMFINPKRVRIEETENKFFPIIFDIQEEYINRYCEKVEG